jgi:oxalate decarboxylase/phosphoglucose isomerase-like protein (cupin superfamily)
MSGEASRVVLQLDELPLERVVAHGGEGRIGLHRLFAAADFRGPWNFVDYAVLPPGASIGTHRHGRNEELYLVLEGEGTIHLDGKSFAVRAGHVVLNRPGGEHGLQNTSQAPLRIFVVEVAVPAIGPS